MTVDEIASDPSTRGTILNANQPSEEATAEHVFSTRFVYWAPWDTLIKHVTIVGFGAYTVPSTQTTSNVPEMLDADMAYTGTRLSSHEPRWQPYVVRRLGEIAAAAHGRVDNHPSPATVRRAWLEALRIFEATTPTPSVVPSGEGGVQFVWHKGGWDLELEVQPEGITVWGHDRTSGVAFYGPLAEQRERLVEVLRGLSQ